MPLIETKGAASSQGLGQFNRSAYCGGDGTKGIFQLGSNNIGTRLTTRNKYTYACCTSTACGVGASSVANRWGSAAGNSTRGIFALGCTCCSYTGNTKRNKYTYSTCTSTACGVGAASTGSIAGAAAGNSTRGIFALGCNTLSSIVSNYNFTTRNKYTYANCTSTATGVASSSRFSAYGAAAGNSTRGIFQIGKTVDFSCCLCYYYLASSGRNKYTYACDTNTSTASATQAAVAGSAAGNSTRGIFALASSCYNPSNIISAVRNKFTYATDTNTSSGVASATNASYAGSAAGNSTRGIFALGYRQSGCNNLRNKYTYACCTSTACGVGTASSTSYRGAAASWVIGVNSNA